MRADMKIAIKMEIPNLFAFNMRGTFLLTPDKKQGRDSESAPTKMSGSGVPSYHSIM